MKSPYNAIIGDKRVTFVLTPIEVENILIEELKRTMNVSSWSSASSLENCKISCEHNIFYNRENRQYDGTCDITFEYDENMKNEPI